MGLHHRRIFRGGDQKVNEDFSGDFWLVYTCKTKIILKGIRKSNLGQLRKF